MFMSIKVLSSEYYPLFCVFLGTKKNQMEEEKQWTVYSGELVFLRELHLDSTRIRPNFVKHFLNDFLWMTFRCIRT